jgi:hypothetical protein
LPEGTLRLIGPIADNVREWQHCREQAGAGSLL